MTENTLPQAEEFQRVLDIPLELTVHLGKRQMRIAELLDVKVDAVIELDTLAGSVLQVVANDTLIARGEVVVVGERYAVRITDIVSRADRVRRIAGDPQ